jgi:hypothetical protein
LNHHETRVCRVQEEQWIHWEAVIVLCRTLWNSFANLLKIKSVSDYVLTAPIYGNSGLSVFRIIGSMRRPVGCLVKDAYQ